MYKINFYGLTVDDTVGSRHTWPLRVEILNSVDDTPAKVIVMHEAAGGVTTGDAFSCIATVQQLNELPEDAVGPNGPFYRVNDVTIQARSPDHVVELKEKIQTAVQELADNVNAETEIALLDTITITPT